MLLSVFGAHYRQFLCKILIVNLWHRDGSSAQVTYTVTDCDANTRPQRELPIEVSRGGLLTTSAFLGQACLLVSSVEDFGVNQSTLVHIKVSFIFYIRLVVSPHAAVRTRMLMRGGPMCS